MTTRVFHTRVFYIRYPRFLDNPASLATLIGETTDTSGRLKVRATFTQEKTCLLPTPSLLSSFRLSPAGWAILRASPPLSCELCAVDSAVRSVAPVSIAIVSKSTGLAWTATCPCIP